MPIRYLDEQPAAPKSRIRFLDEEPTQTDNFSAKGVGMGLADPFYGVGQLAPRAVYEVASLGGNFDNAVARAAQKSYQRVDDEYKRKNTEYESGRKNPEGFDYGRLAGNVLSPANLALPGGIETQSLKQLVAKGTAAAMSMPISDTENYANDKAWQTAAGGITSGIVGKGGQAIGRALNPQTSPQVVNMLAENIKLTPGEMLGGGFKRGEDMLSSIPLVGSLIKGGQRKSIESMNTAAINRSLKPIGKELPKNVSGREAIEYANDTLSQTYDNLLPKLTGKIDKQFADDMDDLDDAVMNTFSLTPDDANRYKGIMDNIVRRRFSNNGTIFGESLKEVQSELGRLSRSFRSDPSASTRELGNALEEAQDNIRKMLQRVNPQYADQLSNLNRGYANFKRVQKAAASLGAQEGVFSPAQLQSAVRALDKSKDKSAFAKGNALMQDLSEPAKARMAQTVPNSGSIDRALAAAVATGGGGAALFNPNPLSVALGAASLSYTPIGRDIAEAILTKRPESVRKVGTAASKYIPYLSAPTSLAVSNEGRY